MAKKKIETDTGPQRVVVLDSHAILHRAYHAIPDLMTSGGTPTGALYGLAMMILKIADELHPDYIIAARDLPGKTHRHDAFEAYKGTRTKADDSLILQLQEAPRVFAAFGIPVYAAPGYEADDVLGTIAETLSHRPHTSVVIASGDMDTLQLVAPRTSVYTLRKGMNDTVFYDEEAVQERYGFGPEHLVDYKGLRGDPSDNIPGVKGIGEKTATTLVQHFGSIEKIYDAVKKRPEEVQAAGVKGATFEKLKAGEADARMSKDLATIRRDVPIPFEMPEHPWRLSDHAETIAQILDEFEFRALKERLGLAARMSSHAADGEAGDDEVSGAPEEDVDPVQLEETSIALWLLHSDLTTPSLDDILAYAHEQSFEKAREKVFSELAQTGRLQDVYERIERPLIPIVRRMHEDGILLDTKQLASLAAEYNKELDATAARVYRVAGHEFNINSPKQLAAILFDELKLSTGGRQKKTAGGALSTREDELQKMAEGNPIVADVLAYRELQKLLGTYIEKIPGMLGSDGRLHAKFLQAGTTTGRMASQDPNLQNIPIKTEYGRRIREAFVAPEGYVLAAIDYSQIELRIAAGLSGDEKLVGVFKNGEDVHTATASHVFGVPPEKVDREMRRRAKVINFGILYGMGANALRANLGAGVSREEAAKYLSEYFTNFEGLARFVEETKASAHKNGYTETLFGRRRHFPGFKSSLPGVVAQAERMAVNAPIQGTQADIIKLAMIDVAAMLEQRGWQKKARLLLQVHDELVYEVAEDEAEEIARAICEAMENIMPASQLSGVPVIAEISIGKNWGETKRIAK